MGVAPALVDGPAAAVVLGRLAGDGTAPAGAAVALPTAGADFALPTAGADFALPAAGADFALPAADGDVVAAPSADADAGAAVLAFEPAFGATATVAAGLAAEEMVTALGSAAGPRDAGSLFFPSGTCPRTD